MSTTRRPIGSARYLAILAVAGAIGPARAEVVKGPYILEMGPRSVRVRFEAEERAETEIRFWPESDPSAVRAFLAVPEPIRFQVDAPSKEDPKNTVKVAKENYLYDARLLGLRPGTRYAYRLLHAGREREGGVFETYCEAASSARFIVVGDVRGGQDQHRRLAAQFQAHCPGFVAVLGDLANNGKVYADWKPFFEIEEAFFRNIPLCPVWGNHDGRDGYFAAYFPFPRKAYSRSFDCGPVHVIVIDSGKAEEPEELRWIDEDLAAARDAVWKVALYHHPSFNEGGHASAYGLAKLVPLLKRHGVDITFTGHSHLYERTFPLKSASRDEKPIIHVVTGGGGATLYSDAEAFYLAAHSKRHHYVLVQADRDRLECRAIGVDGRPFDRFILKKDRGGRPSGGGAPAEAVDARSPGSAEPVISEEAVALWRGLRPSDPKIRFRVPHAKVPARTLPDAVSWVLKIPPCPIARKIPVEIRIDPRDESLWRLLPEVDRFEWGPAAETRSLAIEPRTPEAIARREPPRIRFQVADGPAGFVQVAPLKVTFGTDGKNTVRRRI